MPAHLFRQSLEPRRFRADLDRAAGGPAALHPAVVAADYWHQGRLRRFRPEVELVPVWIDNLNRVLPKGEIIPLPLLCTVTFDTPLSVAPGEESGLFVNAAAPPCWR